MPFTWDETRARYRDSKTGRFVKPEKVIALSEASIEETTTLAQRLAGKSAKEVDKALREEIKRETIRQYMLVIS